MSVRDKQRFLGMTLLSLLAATIIAACATETPDAEPGDDVETREDVQAQADDVEPVDVDAEPVDVDAMERGPSDIPCDELLREFLPFSREARACTDAAECQVVAGRGECHCAQDLVVSLPFVDEARAFLERAEACRLPEEDFLGSCTYDALGPTEVRCSGECYLSYRGSCLPYPEQDGGLDASDAFEADQ